MPGRLIKLLGTPSIIDEQGAVMAVRGHQAWALLARIILSPKPQGRASLSAELFPDSQDPLGSLRWCLAALRKALDSSTSLVGDPVELNLPAGCEVDVHLLGQGKLALDQMGDLLEGITPQSSQALDTWLLAERARISAVIDSHLRSEIVRLLALEDFRAAIQHAELAARREPFDERTHVLLVKSLALAGQLDAALQHVEATERQFQDELGVLPSAALRSAARRSVASPPGGISIETHVGSLIESGLAALAAGAADAGIDNLRHAVAEAERTTNWNLFSRASHELGAALVHAIRGYDEEGAILLHQANEVATTRGYGDVACASFRELAYVEALAGRRPAAAEYVAKGQAFAALPDQRAGLLAVEAFNLVDWGKIENGLSQYQQAIELARQAGNRRREAWAWGMGAWGLLAADDVQTAATWSQNSMALVEEERWLAFRPWPMTLFCEAGMRQKPADTAMLSTLQSVFSASCHLRDPCWEGVAAKSISRWFAQQDDIAQARHWAEEGQKRCSRETDSYIGLQVCLMGDIAELKRLAGDHTGAAAAARSWVASAAKAHMDDQVARASKLLMSL